jgi:hypothetical protein
MNYNHLFIPGQEVSAFIKDSNKIWEGIIIDRSDGIKVVLNENTNQWKKLSDLDHIKRTGKLLYEEDHQEEATDLIKDFNSFTQATLNKGDEKDLEDVAKDPSKKDQLANHLITISKANPDIKDTPSSPDEAVKTVDENIASVLSTKKAGNAPGDQAAIEAAQMETEKLIGKQVNETIKQLHPIVRNRIYEMSQNTYHHCREFFNRTHDEKKTIKMLELYGMSKKVAEKTVNTWKEFEIEIGSGHLNESDGWAYKEDGPGVSPSNFLDETQPDSKEEAVDALLQWYKMSPPIAQELADTWWRFGKLREDIDKEDFADWARDKHEAGDLDKDAFNLIKDYVHDVEDKEMDEKTKKDSIKKSMDYEDNDYLDIPDEVKKDVISRVKDLLADDQADIEDVIKSQFELSDEDAEEFIIQAMEEYIDETEIEPRNSIANASEEDPVEADFEDTIDKYDGPTEGLLTYLSDEYEIEPGEAEKIYDEKKGNLTECIFEFVKIVRNRLIETGALGAIGNMIGFQALQNVNKKKEKSFKDWNEKDAEEWIKKVNDAEDPGKTRMWPSGYYASHLVPPGVQYPAELIRGLLKLDVPDDIIEIVVPKVFPGFFRGNTVEILRFINDIAK